MERHESSLTPDVLAVETVVSEQEQDSHTPEISALTNAVDCSGAKAHEAIGISASAVKNKVDHSTSPKSPEQKPPTTGQMEPTTAQETKQISKTTNEKAHQYMQSWQSARYHLENAEVSTSTSEQVSKTDSENMESTEAKESAAVKSESAIATTSHEEGPDQSPEQSEPPKADEKTVDGTLEIQQEPCGEAADEIHSEADGEEEDVDDEEDGEDNNVDDGDEDTENNDLEEVTDDNELEGILAGLPQYIVRRVNCLKTLDRKREVIMAEYLKERAALEVKYAALCGKLFHERAEVINGSRDEEIAQARAIKIAPSADTSAKEEKKEDEPEAVEAEDIREDSSADEPLAKGIPQFWVCAMGHMEVVGSLITEEDVDCLEYIENITCVDDNDGKGFTLTFFFAPNPYFENATLTKRYEVPNLLFGDEPVLKNVTGCKVRWKTDQSLTFTVIKKKQRGKGKHAGQVRTVTKRERKESMFHWFDPPPMPSIEDMDEEEVQKLEELFDHDYDVAQAFRMHIIPKAVHWFTGQAAQQELEEAVDELIEAN